VADCPGHAPSAPSPLSARLGGAFGLVAVLLLAVAVLRISRVGAVKHDVNDLGLRKLHAQALIGAIADRTGANAQATTQSAIFVVSPAIVWLGVALAHGG
jgi:hypothetical protein